MDEWMMPYATGKRRRQPRQTGARSFDRSPDWVLSRTSIPLPPDAWREIRWFLGLSPREFEIALLITEGLGENEIAALLDRSTHTVHTHMGRMYLKLGVSSRCALVAQLFRAHVALCKKRSDG
jgi:DNA-binding CsgD family transcriptional regulator